jgi:hypothetical protein
LPFVNLHYADTAPSLFGLGAGLGGPLGGFMNDHFGWCVRNSE